MQNDNICRVFFIFSNFIFLGLLLGAKEQKKKVAKDSDRHTPYLIQTGTIHHVIVIYGAHVYNDNTSR